MKKTTIKEKNHEHIIAQKEEKSMQHRDFVIKSIENMSGRHSPYEVFADWVKMSAISIQNACVMIHDKVWKDREQQYMLIQKKYAKDEMMTFSNMLAAVTLTFDEKFDDALGDVYMRSGCGNKGTGQFFTPYHISYATAAAGYTNDIKKLSQDNVIEVAEPSCGAGGMIIAIAQLMKDNGLNPQRNMHVTAQDLDWTAVYMTYVQLSLLGIRATVVQGDSLAEPYKPGYPKERVWHTPAEMGALL